MGLLVYCSEEDIEKYKALAEKEELEVHVNLNEIEKIRSLGSNDCILQSKEELMRGVDYNCKPNGLKLLIATDFSSDRSLMQGLGRVGRYGEMCRRYVVPTLTLVNQTKSIQLAGLLRKNILGL